MIRRRNFLGALAGGAAALSVPRKSFSQPSPTAAASLPAAAPDEDILRYLQRVRGGFDDTLYKRILGAANAFKEGDEIIAVAAADEASRRTARDLLGRTKLQGIDARPLLRDQLGGLLSRSLDAAASQQTAAWTFAQLKRFLLRQGEPEIHAIRGGLSSAVIGCVVKLMSDEELVAVAAKVFNPLPGGQIGAKGYLGARIQPNSPTDNVEDIRWQVFNGWSYAVGDVLLGANPVSSDPASVRAIQRTLRDLLAAFELQDVLPHCVLSHIDVQAEVERDWPGDTALWFQSIAGTDAANKTFDISVDKMLNYASQRNGRYGLYFETGQGADFTNGHGGGFDMVLHEARKYGFARALQRKVAEAQRKAGAEFEPWVHVNDVAGFIGPEVFRTREQLVRCCLEDIVMGKLHGLCIGLDVCSTLHMDVSLTDLDWCLDRAAAANPAYLMALPTKIDPMLGYLTTGFQDHVRLRQKFGYRVSGPMEKFFQRLGVLDQRGRPGEYFGDPSRVYLQYRRRLGDARDEAAILQEAQRRIAEVRGRGVFIAEGRGAQPWDLAPSLQRDIQRIYNDAKKSIWAELSPTFISQIPNAIRLRTQSKDRNDYILHPASGEQLSADSLKTLQALRKKHGKRYDVQIVIADGLNAHAIMDQGHLAPFLKRLREKLRQEHYRTAPEHLVVASGRVRAGYRIGESLFAGQVGAKAILHVIGERPGTGHHTFSIYITAPDGETWSTAGKVDHNITKVVSGVAATALAPVQGAEETVRILNTFV